MMHACGLIVEYNPFHHGHQYHIEQAKKLSGADCIIAIMSGPFLQRGEPAIIDKFHRAKTALLSGVDLVLELPYPYAVQSSALFAKGAVQSLGAIGVSSICFGSESGDITPFIHSVKQLEKNQTAYDEKIRSFLDEGDAFPKASAKAYQAIGIDKIDLFQPNNILGFSYTKEILKRNDIKPLTIKRMQSHYHDEKITGPITSATSIRRELMKANTPDTITKTVPASSLHQIEKYKKTAMIWHNWEHYFPFLTYQLMSKTNKNLAEIQGIDEGLEYRIQQMMPKATSFDHLLEMVKTKRYTQTRLQRAFTHLLTNTTKCEMSAFTENNSVPYLRLLGMTKTGQAYLNERKKAIELPVLTNLSKKTATLTFLDERATNIYYAPLHVQQRKLLRKQEFHLPIIISHS